MTSSFVPRQRSAYLAGLGRVASNVQDRNRGRGLPSGIGDDGFQRMAAVLERRANAVRPDAPRRAQRRTASVAEPMTVGRRFASVGEVEAAGFRRLAPGFYQQAAGSLEKAAHPIWELRGAEDGEGYVLLRRREERSVDLRTAGEGAFGGAGTAAAVSAGIVRQARTATKGPSKQAAPASFLVSLLQTPGGSIRDRKTIFTNEVMDLDALQRLVSELKMGPADLTHDTWSDGEWELRVRGPKGQLIHEYESTGPDEIGGAKGQTLLDTLSSVIPNAAADLEGLPPEAGAMLGMEDVLPPEEAPPADVEMAPPGAPMAPGAPAPGAPAPGAPGAPVAGPPLAPTSAALRRGSRILVLAQGGVADAVVLMVNPQQQAIEVMFGGGQTSMVPIGDVLGPDLGPNLEPEVELELEPASDDALVEITADDIGEHEHDPFEVPVSPASEESPVEFEGTMGVDLGKDFERAAARYLTARMHVEAVEFMGSFRPGAVLEARKPFKSYYQGVDVPEGAELTVEGFHVPGQDDYYGLTGLRDLQPNDDGSNPYTNLRIRVSTPSGHTLLLTESELDLFDFARGGAPGESGMPFDDDTESFEDLPRVPMGEREDVDPYGQTTRSGPPGEQTQPGRPRGRPPRGFSDTVVSRPPQEE